MRRRSSGGIAGPVVEVDVEGGRVLTLRRETNDDGLESECDVTFATGGCRDEAFRASYRA